MWAWGEGPMKSAALCWFHLPMKRITERPNHREARSAFRRDTCTRMLGKASLRERLLDEQLPAPKPSARVWKLAATSALLVALVLAAVLVDVLAQNHALREDAASPAILSADEAAHPSPSAGASSKDLFRASTATDEASPPCTPAGKDMHANDAGKKLPCCPGLVEEKAPCRKNDQCDFCFASPKTTGHRAEYPPATISVDPATPKEAVEKHKEKGWSLILSDEFKDMARTKSIFVFEDIPYGVPGNTGDVNIVSIYSSDTISLLPEGGRVFRVLVARPRTLLPLPSYYVGIYSQPLHSSHYPEGGLRLAAYMSPKDEKRFMEGWNGTYNTNWGSDVSLWDWHAPKVTSRVNGRFQYGRIETRLKAPKGCSAGSAL